MGKFNEYWDKWWYGDPPMEDKVYDTIFEEFNLILYISGLFPDPRPIRRLITVGILICNVVNCAAYFYFLGVTATIQIEDFVTASQTVHFAGVDLVAVTCMISIVATRSRMIELFKTIADNYFDYGDDFEIPEMTEEYRTTKKQKIIILVVLPCYLALNAVVCMMGRTIDGYFGRASNETYENGVYMLTPEPMWYPFTINNDLMHWLIVLSQATGAFALASAVSGTAAILVLFCQSIGLQFKIMIFRIRKAEQCAYQQHIKNGGKELKRSELYSDPSFLRYYNSNLNKLAEHHSILIKQFKSLYEVGKWPAGIALLMGSLLIAMSLLALLSGDGKPSILILAALLIVAEVMNIALICGQSESVQELGESLHEELYNMNWTELDPAAKKTIMMMIRRSKRPLVLMAGGLKPLNWESFSVMMNTAYSYVNLLLAADV